MMHMMRTVGLCWMLTLVMTAVAAASSIEIRLQDGTRWRGETTDVVELTVRERGSERNYTGRILEVHDLYVVVEVEMATGSSKRPLMRNDILAINTVGSKEEEDSADADSRRGSRGSARTVDEAKPNPNAPAIFVLPLKGTVGTYVRHEEIAAVGKMADKYGPGQIIILQLNTPGGLVTEMEQISATLLELKRRHRVIAWIREAISAGCATALHCDEIYFMTEGSAGAMTAFAGDSAWKGEELRKWLETAGRWAEAGGRSPYIAHAMIHHPRMLSYDKDPETGEVTFYPNLSGQFVLSDENDNLVFTSSQAVHSGFAQGIADTEEELAKLLDLDEWYETSQESRRMAREWQRLVETAEIEIPRLAARLDYEGTGTGDDIIVMNKQIQNLRELINWWRRCPNVCTMMGVPPVKQLERAIEELRRAVQQRRGR